MERSIKQENSGSDNKITTIKLERSTKDRIDKLRVYKRETYDEILQNLLTILNICKVNPEAARKKLLLIDRTKRKQKGNLPRLNSQYSNPNQNRLNNLRK